MPTRSHLAPPESDSSGGICISAGDFSRESTSSRTGRYGFFSGTGTCHIGKAPLAIVYEGLSDQALQQRVDRRGTLSRTLTVPRLKHCSATVAGTTTMLSDVVDRRSAVIYTGLSHSNESLKATPQSQACAMSIRVLCDWSYAAVQPSLSSCRVYRDASIRVALPRSLLHPQVTLHQSVACSMHIPPESWSRLSSVGLIMPPPLQQWPTMAVSRSHGPNV